MCKNALKYNAPESLFYHCGEQLLQFIERRFPVTRWPDFEPAFSIEDIMSPPQQQAEISDVTDSDDPFHE